MKVLKKNNVFDEALERIRFIYDEFEEVIVNFSGGKDSTVVLNLTIMVAREKNRLPVKVMFIDQEAEWDHNIEYIRKTFARPEVEGLWYQMPIKIFNATSHKKEWLQCWAEGEEWIRPKEPNAITKNVYGTDRFAELFYAIMKVDFKGKKAAYVAGVRTEETPKRYVGLTSNACYKWVTWGRKYTKDMVAFYPIYDWSYTDVWKAIHDNGWQYCKIYDYMYRYGIAPKDMRISNLHHETAIHALYFLQEIEPHNWNRLTARLSGVDTTAKIAKKDMFSVKELPFMFGSWKEYRDYLVENLIEREETRERFRKKFKQMDDIYFAMNHIEDMYKTQIKSILLNDWEFTKIINWERSPYCENYRNYMKYGNTGGYKKYNKYIPVRKDDEDGNQE